jgi:hypothetical protein
VIALSVLASLDALTGPTESADKHDWRSPEGTYSIYNSVARFVVVGLDHLCGSRLEIDGVVDL